MTLRDFLTFRVKDTVQRVSSVEFLSLSEFDNNILVRMKVHHVGANSQGYTLTDQWYELECTCGYHYKGAGSTLAFGHIKNFRIQANNIDIEGTRYLADKMEEIKSELSELPRVSPEDMTILGVL